MKNDNGSLLLNLGMAIVLIVLGFINEPLLGVLGAMMIVVAVIAQVAEDVRKKRRIEQELEWTGSLFLAK